MGWGAIFVLANDTGPRPGHFIFSSQKKLSKSKLTSQDTPRVLDSSVSPRSSTLSCVICPQFEHPSHLVDVSLSRPFLPHCYTGLWQPACRPWGHTLLSALYSHPAQHCLATPTVSHTSPQTPPLSLQVIWGGLPGVTDPYLSSHLFQHIFFSISSECSFAHCRFLQL